MPSNIDRPRMNSDQDFKKVVFRNPKASIHNASGCTESLSSQMQKLKVNKSHGAHHVQKLDNSTTSQKQKTISASFKKALQQARMAKKMSQKQLGGALHESVSVIQSYENGTAIPQGHMIHKLNKILGCKLPSLK